MEGIDKHIDTCYKTTIVCSSSINRGQCNSSDDTAKTISENHAIESVTKYIDDTCKKQRWILLQQ